VLASRGLVATCAAARSFHSCQKPILEKGQDAGCNTLQKPSLLQRVLQQLRSGKRSHGDQLLNPSAGAQGVLQQLRAVNCSRLVRVVIQMPKDSALQGINLASCRSLRAAEISAGQLETLNLNDCPALAEVHFSCASLRCCVL